MRVRNLWMFVSAIAILVAMLSMMNLYFAQNEFRDETERLKLTHQNKEDSLEKQLSDLQGEVSQIKMYLKDRNQATIQEEEPKSVKDFEEEPPSNLDYKSIPKRPLYDPSFQSDIDDLRTKTCSFHTIHRDYSKSPVQHVGRGTGQIDCPIPCINGQMDIGGSSDPHSKQYDATMENTGNAVGGIRHLSGNTHLYADVVMQYFSWAEYDFMQPPVPKNKDQVLAAFISNCGPQYRLQWLQELMDSGLSVHSYGSCKNNRAEPPRGSSGHEAKQKLIAAYKFTFSFENSMTDDYVTEKLFQPLVAGSVPVYYGAPNAKRFAPDNHSVIFAQDFKDAKSLAEYLKYLNENDTAYNEYLQWKKVGPSQEWISLVDLSILHSECRFCIRSADIDRLTVGEVVTGPYVQENEEEMNKYKGNSNTLMLKIRERGQFYLRRIHLTSFTFAELKRKIMAKWSDDNEKGEIVWIYELWDRNKELIDSDLRVNELQNGHELEVVFSRPGNKDRHDYYRWWQKNKQ